MSNKKPSLGDFGYIIAGRAVASLVVALAVSIAFVLVLAGYYGQAAFGLVSLLCLAFLSQQLVLSLDPGRSSPLFGLANRTGQPALFLLLFIVFVLVDVVLIIGIIRYLLAF